MKYHQKALVTGIIVALTGFSSTVSASGFQLFEQSISGLGNAFAGSAASAQDASTIFFNPAGMSKLSGTQIIAGAHLISPSAHMKNEFVTASAATPGAVVTGNDGNDGGVNAILPNFYVSHQLNNTINIGLGINAPFGLSTNYKDGWIGRYHALKTDLRTVNINPAISFKVNDKLTLGAGINAMYTDLRDYSNNLDAFAVCAKTTTALFGPASIGPNCAVPLGTASFGNAATDGKVKLEGDDWGYGVNLGVIYQSDENTRIGLHYRSKVTFQIEGKVDFTFPTPTLFFATSQSTGFTAGLDLPETINLSSFQKINNKWDMMGDISWTNWSRFETLVATFDKTIVGSTGLNQPENWEDTYKFSLGMTYHHTPELDFRFGVAYDQAAVAHTTDRSMRIPDNDRTWLSFGVSYAAAKNIQLDLAYAHLFIDDGDVRFTDQTFGYTLNGKVETDVDILSGQVRWIF